MAADAGDLDAATAQRLDEAGSVTLKGGHEARRKRRGAGEANCVQQPVANVMRYSTPPDQTSSQQPDRGKPAPISVQLRRPAASAVAAKATA